MSTESEQSPFPRGLITRGYPLDREEKAALQEALREIEDARSQSQTHDGAFPESRSPDR